MGSKAGRILVVALVTVLVTTACSGKSDTQAEQVSHGSKKVGRELRIKVSPEKAIKFSVPGVGTVTGGRGSVENRGSIRVSRVRFPRPPSSVQGVPVASVGEGLWIDVSEAKLAKPLTVVFDQVNAAPDEAVFVAHLSDRGRWDLIEADRAPTTLTARTRTFSVLTWITSHIFDPVRDFIVEKLTGRTAPVSCEPKPAWADATPPPSGSTHACVRIGQPTTDGAEVAELDLKSNRGMYQWVQVPATLTREFVWVEDQADLVRAIVAKLVHSDHTILLPPGKRMTVGYRQPTAPTQLDFLTYPNSSAQIVSMVKWLLDFFIGPDELINAIGALYCANVVQSEFSPTGPSGNLSWPSASRKLVECATSLVTGWGKDPSKAASAAGALLGSPLANEEQLTSLAQRLYTTGKKAVVVDKIVSLGSIAIQQLTFVIDAAVAGLGAENAGTAVLTLDARPSSVSSAACPSAGEANRLLVEAAVIGIDTTTPVRIDLCRDGWATGTISKGPSGSAGEVIYRYSEGAWRYVASAGFHSLFCDILLDALSGFYGQGETLTPSGDVVLEEIAECHGYAP